MLFYAAYLIGYAGCQVLPVPLLYWIARRMGAWYYSRMPQSERDAVRNNLSVIQGRSDVPESQVVEVFQNFALYLVDFFRFGRLTQRKVRRWIRIEGVEKMRAALSRGKGAIGVTAHLGNFELAGGVLSLMGLPVNAAVLVHQNRRVNAFFVSQRERVGVRGIPLQKASERAFFEAAMGALRRNEILALVGDRNFFSGGLELPFLGRTMKVPTGPAAFSVKTGAPIVPGFLVREPDRRYRFVLEDPIFPPEGVPREEAIRALTQASLDVMAKYIRRYPTQWYIFHEFWTQGPGPERVQ